MFLVIMIIALTILDQATKYIAVLMLHNTGVITHSLWEGIFSFTYLENRGAILSILEDKRYIFITLSTVMILYFIYRLIFKKTDSRIFRLGMALVVAGGIGNLIDRLFRGFVVDFLYFELINFPIFNVADSCVSIGTVILCISLIFEDMLGKKGLQNGSEGNSRDIG